MIIIHTNVGQATDLIQMIREATDVSNASSKYKMHPWNIVDTNRGYVSYGGHAVPEIEITYPGKEGFLLLNPHGETGENDNCISILVGAKPCDVGKEEFFRVWHPLQDRFLWDLYATMPYEFLRIETINEKYRHIDQDISYFDMPR